MAATTPTVIDLHINRFCNCDGCIRKVKTALEEVGGVELLSMDPDTGKLTISTTKHPQVIQFALQKKFKKVVDILPQQMMINNSPSYSLSASHNVQDMAEALVKISRAKGLESAEFRQSNTYKFKFNQSSSSTLGCVRIKDVDSDYVMPPPRPSTTEPSAPLIPTTEGHVTGYPADHFYGTFSKSSRNDHPHGCCTIL